MLTRYIFRQTGEIEVLQGQSNVLYQIDDIAFIDSDSYSEWIICKNGGNSLNPESGAQFKSLSKDDIPKEYLAKLLLMKG